MAILKQRAALRFSLLVLLVLLSLATPVWCAGDISAKDRVKIFEEVWRAINDNYYDPAFNGINWQAVRDRYRPRIAASANDQQFYQLVNEMVGELRDAHTRFRTPMERERRERQMALSVGISIYEIEGKPIIINVNPLSNAAMAGLEVGMELRAIDGQPIAERLAELRELLGESSSERAQRLLVYGGLLQGEPGTDVELDLVGIDARAFKITLTREQVGNFAKVSSRRLASGIGYIRLNRWIDPIHEQFKAELKNLQDTRGLIIDLRGNPGGQLEEMRQIASYFLGGKISLGRLINRSGKPKEIFADNVTSSYRAPVAILVDELSGSASEIFAGVMQQQGRAIVIGNQSCGCVLAVKKRRKIKGGGELSISEFGYLLPKGSRLEGVGVMPDQSVKYTLADLQNKHDAAIKAAETSLLSEQAAK